MNFARWCVVAGILLVASSAQAGTIHPALQDQMDRTSEQIPISAIVYLEEQAPIQQLSAELDARGATLRERHRVVIEALQKTATRTQEPLLRYLDEALVRGSVQGYTSYWIANMIVIQATKSEIARIAASIDVDLIEPSFRGSLIEPVGSRPPVEYDEDGLTATRGIGIPPGIRAVRAPEVWYQLGFTGAGRLIGGLDTGVDGNHPALRTRWRGYMGANPWQECWLDVLGTATQFPNDGHGHGTHTMGTMTGLASDDSIGVAPGALWIACNAINQGVGSGFDSDITTAFQWFADPDGNPNTSDDVPDVVQNSWGVYEGLGYPANCDSRWWTVLDGCAAAGIVLSWSAGNEGPGAQTLRSPADRATTTLEAFSVGAVNATSYGWPYPIASFSSRGPSGCNVPEIQKTKPEVVAPGVSVYSSVPGGGYQQSGWDGTSMAGPHAAGIVALMRQANPNIGVDDIKQILLDTARDEGTAGEDNTYGWGFVDAYAAVQNAMVGFGTISGKVSNASWLGTPIEGATVTVVEADRSFATNSLGQYTGDVAAGLYTVTASHPSFSPQTVNGVVIEAGMTTQQNFTLIDIAGPAISAVTDPQTTTDTVGPYTIQATITDHSTVAAAKLYYRMNGGGWIEAAMTQVRGVYEAAIPGMPAGNQIDYYVWARDGIGLEATSPAGAPGSFYTLYITEMFFVDDVETQTGWQLGATGDNATAGIWIHADPVGTTYGSPPQQVQPEDDHTPAPGVICYVTGNGLPGGGAGDADVDGGCTTLLSPIFDLEDATMAFVSYHRWFGEAGNSTDDEFAVDVSSNGGTSWVPLERVPNNDNTWRKMTFRIDTFVPLTAQIRFRFVACDLNQGGLIEAAIDDLAIESFTPNPGAVDQIGGGLAPQLSQNAPNPFRPGTTINFRLSNAGQARLEIFDASGRLVRTLFDRQADAGQQQVTWDGLDDQGHQVGSGVYFYRLTSGAFQQSRRLTILR